MRRVKLEGLKESLQGSGFAKRGCDHCCDVGPPRRMGRGITEGVAGVGRRDEKQWLGALQNANSRMMGPLRSIGWHSCSNIYEQRYRGGGEKARARRIIRGKNI